MKSFHINCYFGGNTDFKTYLYNWILTNSFKHLNLDEINLLRSNHARRNCILIYASNNCYTHKIFYKDKEDCLAKNQGAVLVSSIQEFQKALLYRELGIHPKDDPNFYGEGDERDID